MDSLIREANENLKTIINNMKSNLDNSISTLDNIQMQMDKKVEEAKKYKIQVDSAKEIIKELEESNKSLELSLKELNDKYGKMNLVSLVEAGNREIKTKINDNNREINKQKEHIAELTNKARTIKDLLLNLKKDKSIKEERLENIKTVYGYYSERINDIIDYAFNHSLNLGDYKNSYNYVDNYEEVDEEVNNTELENTMVFDEIANIDDNKNFKDEMTFINDQIDNTFDDSNEISEIIKKNLEKYNLDQTIEETNEEEIQEEVLVNDDKLDSTQVFDSIFKSDEINEKIDDIKEEIEFENNQIEEEIIQNENDYDNFEVSENTNVNDLNLFFNSVNEDKEGVKTLNSELFIDNSTEDKINEQALEDNDNNLDLKLNLDDVVKKEVVEESNNKDGSSNLGVFNMDTLKSNEEIEENEDRINKIDDLFSSIDNTKISNINNLNNIEPINVNGTLNKIDNAYMDVFGKPLEENELNKKETTLTDIFGNPIKNEDLSEEVKIGKRIEDLFVENGIDFNKFKDDEQNYLKQIYDEEKFNNIINTLKRNKISLDNIYNSFNIFGEISANELENLISKLINSGQSVEAIGLVLEKLPKVKKYNLDDAIISYGDYIKDIDITELIMKAKELYNGGNN